MKYLVDVAFVYPEALEACHEKLRLHFEPLIQATQEYPEVHVLTAITLRLVRLSKATMLLSKAGLKEESMLPYRSATESIINLLYITYAGSVVEGKSSRELASQFIAYGDLAYFKMLKRRPNNARSAFKSRAGMSDAEFDLFLQEKERLAEESATLHNCSSARWHRMNLVNMAEKVCSNIPSFVDQATADLVFSTFVSVNSATHADALSLRSQYKDLGNAPLELAFEEEHVNASIASKQALWAWQTMAEYYNQMDFVNECFNCQLQEIVKKRRKVSV